MSDQGLGMHSVGAPRGTPQRLRPPLSRRRDKPQLSCNGCRRRKQRCDRQYPCHNCIKRGCADSCYFPATGNHEPSDLTDVIGRTHQLDRNVVSSNNQSIENNPNSIFDDCSAGPETSTPSFVDDHHWTAVLNSIADLRICSDPELSSGELPANATVRPPLLTPGLLYRGYQMDQGRQEIIRCLPPKRSADRLISVFFTLDIAAGIPHSGKFLREYDEFWQAPDDAPIAWVGLLYGILCLGMLHRETSVGGTYDPTLNIPSVDSLRFEAWKGSVIQCLLLARYTQGGPHVLEALFIYFALEIFRNRNDTAGQWMLLGSMVQIALHSGYHRDPRHFPSISAFDGEMRRRVWGVLVHLEYTFSEKLALPSLITEGYADTAEPGNFNDSDFTEASTLPPERSDVEITSTSYLKARLRLISLAKKMSGLLAFSQSLPDYHFVTELDAELGNFRRSIPTGMQWRGLALCLDVPAQKIIQQIVLEVEWQRQRLMLHRKFFLASRTNLLYDDSRKRCVTAALEILDLQRLLEDESSVEGRFRQNPRRVTAIFDHDFLHATSIICFYVRSFTAEQRLRDTQLDDDHVEHILRTSRDIWSQHAEVSTEASKAAAAISYVLDRRGLDEDASFTWGVAANETDAWEFPESDFADPGFEQLLSDGIHWPWPWPISSLSDM